MSEEVKKLEYSDIREGVVISLAGVDIDIGVWYEHEVQACNGDGSEPESYEHYQRFYENILKDSIVEVCGTLRWDLSTTSDGYPESYADIVQCRVLFGRADEWHYAFLPPDVLTEGRFPTSEDRAAWEQVQTTRLKKQAATTKDKKERKKSIQNVRDKFYADALLACAAGSHDLRLTVGEERHYENGRYPSSWWADAVVGRAQLLLDAFDCYHDI